MQIPELHLLEVVEEWNRRNSYLNFFSSAVSGFEAEREFKYSQLLCELSWKTRLVIFLTFQAESTDFCEAGIMGCGQHRLS